MKFTYLLASVALASVTSAQVSVDWAATHPNATGISNMIFAVAVDATGRVAVVVGNGYELPDGGLISDYETCLYGSDGTLAWSRTKNVSYDDDCYAVAFDGTGGIFVAGSGQDLASGSSDRTLLHYDAVGNLLWSNTLPGTGRDSNRSRALALCSNGDVILAGTINRDLSLERFDSSGNSLWSWIADGSNGGRDSLSAVAVGPGGDVWATGVVGNSSGIGKRPEIVLVRLTSAGVPVWIRTLDNTAHGPGSGQALVVDAAGNTTVAGQLVRDAAIARWDPAGNLAWVRTFDGDSQSFDNDRASRIALDPFGRIVAAGSVANGPSGWESAVWCLDTAGSLMWQGTWDGGSSWGTSLGDLVVDPMGAVWLCGTSSVFAVEVYVTIASWDSTGAFRWSWRTDPGTNAFGYVAALSGNSVIVAGGVSAGSLNGLILKLNRTAVEYCFGDGSSTPCPCANASAPEQHAGCANALGLGARLVDKGASSLAADTLVLEGSQMSSGDALYFQGTSSTSGGAGQAFGDGISCVGGTLIRLGSSTNVGGASRFPDVGDPSVSTRGLVTTPGSRRTYQTWYRDASAFCTTANFNFSNGLLITWTL